MTLAGDMLGAFDTTTKSWIVMQSRIEEGADTRISGPLSLSANEGELVSVTLVNDGTVSLTNFADWDVILEMRLNPGLEILYLDYNASSTSTPQTNEWVIQEIYLSAASSTPEVVNPNIFDPGEEMVVLLNPDPATIGGNVDRLTFTTPNGVTVKMIFKVFNTSMLYVVDDTDMLVYRYREDNSSFLGTSALDSLNADPRGITIDNGRFWTADIVDDKAYEYQLSFSTSSNWELDSQNVDPAGITTDGTNIYVVDKVEPKIYKYDMTGIFDSRLNLHGQNQDASGITTDGTYLWVADEVDDEVYKYNLSAQFQSKFSLTSGNNDPTGITTDGTNLWVVDVVDDKVYKYDLSGTFISSFSLTAANGDPQGITFREAS